MDAIRASFRIFQAIDRPQGRLEALAPSPREVTITDERARAAPRPVEAAAAGAKSDGASDPRQDGGGAEGSTGARADARELWAQDMRVRAEQSTEREGLPPLPSFEYSVGDDGRFYATDQPDSLAAESQGRAEATAVETAAEAIGARPQPDAEREDPGLRARDGPGRGADDGQLADDARNAGARARIIERAYAAPLEQPTPPVIDSVT